MKNFLFIFLLFPIFSLIGQQYYTFSGKVLNENAQPQAYTTITNSEYSFGTMTDDEGNFTLKIPEGEHILLFQYIGYKEYRDTLLFFSDIQKNYQLELEDLTTEDVIITSDGRDPAYGIIEKAIARKKQNATPFPEYSYDSYTKSIIGFPKNFSVDSLDLGLNLKIKSKKAKTEEKKEEIPPELKSKILYLSETLSEVSIKEPEKAKENILSSRVSGDSKSYSLWGNMISRFNPYDNRLVMEGIADRGIVLPLSESAMLYYDFKLLGVGNQNGIKYYKIKLLPKREYDPICKGMIYIADSSFAIKEIEIVVSKTQNIEVMDTLRFRQQYSMINDKWLPYSTRMGFDFIFDLGVMKLPLAGASVSLLSHYNVVPQFEKNTFKNEIISVSDSALSKPKKFWDEVRPIPLTLEEARDFSLKDSLEQLRRSPRYLDSLQHRNNKIQLYQLIVLGQTYNYHRRDLSLFVHPILESVGFSPPEGLFFNPYATFTKKLVREKKIQLDARLRYGFLSKKIGYLFESEIDGNKRKLEKWKLGGGDYIAQFSGFDQIDMYINTMNCLLYKRSRARLYQQKSIFASYERELFNGFLSNISFRIEDRTGLKNLTDYSWNRTRRELYTSNDPANPFFPQTFTRNQALIGQVQLSYTPGQQFISVPYQKLLMGSKYPTFQAIVTHVFPFNSTSSDFTKIKLSISHDLKLGILGNFEWNINVGKFLSTKKLYFPDLFHYKAVETHIHQGTYQAFFLLPYYQLSDTLPYLETHLQHAFHGFLLNKVPLVRKLKLNEYVSAHGLWQQGRSPYLEMSVGVEKNLLKILPLRIDFCVRLLGNVGKPWDYKVWTPETNGIQLGGN